MSNVFGKFFLIVLNYKILGFSFLSNEKTFNCGHFKMRLIKKQAMLDQDILRFLAIKVHTKNKHSTQNLSIFSCFIIIDKFVYVGVLCTTY